MISSDWLAVVTGDEAPEFPALHDAAQAWVAIGSTGQADATGGPLQRAWVYLLILIGVVLLGVRSRRRIDVILALVAVALLLYTAEILVASPIVTYRYMYPAVTTASVLAVLLAASAVRFLVGRHGHA